MTVVEYLLICAPDEAIGVGEAVVNAFVLRGGVFGPSAQGHTRPDCLSEIQELVAVLGLLHDHGVELPTALELGEGGDYG